MVTSWLFYVYTAREGLSMIINWFLKPLNTPAVFKNCSRYGGKSTFICSNSFRVNAHQKKLDIWLIYKCEACGDSWNMEILTGKKPAEIKRELFSGFLENDIDLAYQYAFDSKTLSRNKVTACYDSVKLAVQGDRLHTELLRNGPVTLVIKTHFDVPIRLDRLLSEEIGMSRKLVRECLKTKAIWSDRYGFTPEKPAIKLSGSLSVHFDLSAMLY
jgi:hypothetical protein